jgi:hypothetical protein
MVLLTIPVAIIRSLRWKLARKIKLSLILMPGFLVLGISSVRMYLVVVGQWNTDMSWSYNPLLAIESAEIGSTLIALSIPALKPLFGTLFASLDMTKETGGAQPDGWRFGNPRFTSDRSVELADQSVSGFASRLFRRLSPRSTSAPAPHVDSVNENLRSQQNWGPRREPSLRSTMSQRPVLGSQQYKSTSQEWVPG